MVAEFLPVVPCDLCEKEKIGLLFRPRRDLGKRKYDFYGPILKGFRPTGETKINMVWAGRQISLEDPLSEPPPLTPAYPLKQPLDPSEGSSRGQDTLRITEPKTRRNIRAFRSCEKC